MGTLRPKYLLYGYMEFWGIANTILEVPCYIYSVVYPHTNPKETCMLRVPCYDYFLMKVRKKEGYVGFRWSWGSRIWGFGSFGLGKYHRSYSVRFRVRVLAFRTNVHSGSGHPHGCSVSRRY